MLSYLTTDRLWLSRLIKGSDTEIVRYGVVDRRALCRAHMSDDDLAEDLWLSGISNVAEVAEARHERRCKLSVIQRGI